MRVLLCSVLPILVLFSGQSYSAEEVATRLEVREMPDASDKLIISLGADEHEYSGEEISKDIVFDETFFPDRPYRPAVLDPGDSETLTIEMHIILCDQTCDPLAVYFRDVPSEIDSEGIEETCRSSSARLKQTFRRYFFCRSQFKIFDEQGKSDFQDAHFAAFGWIEAAYKLNELLRYKGYPIFRDKEAERLAQTLEEDSGFIDDVRPAPGYLSGMVRNIAESEKRKVQYAEFLSSIGKSDAALLMLGDLVVQALTESEALGVYRNEEDLEYVRSVYERLFPRLQFCKLTGAC